MALIACPDCGRSVSNKAVACPDCARPIASDRSLAEPDHDRRGLPNDDVASGGDDPKLDVGDLAKLHREKVATRVPGVSKVCERCGADVAEDMFRMKTGRGYVCADCQDAELERNFRAREWRTKVLWVTAVVLFVGATVTGAIMAASVVSTSKSTTTPKH